VFQGQVSREICGHVIGVTSRHGSTDRTHDLLGGVAVVTCHMVNQTRLGESKPARKKLG